MSLIDFEWAGKEEEVRYPADISMGESMEWHKDVGREGMIMKAHDTYRLTRMIGSA